LPVGIGHPCFGCSEQGVGFGTSLYTLATVKDLTPPVFFSEAFPNTPGVSGGIKSMAMGASGLVVGAAGAAVMTGMGKKDEGEPPPYLSEKKGHSETDKEE
jgi:hydrogenase small subunit